MEQMKIKITSSENLLKPPLDEQIIKGAIFIEDAPYALHVSNVTIHGKYHREYKIIAFCIGLNINRVLIHGDLLIICLWSDILIIDLIADKLLRVVPVADSGELLGIYKFKSGYFVNGELENYFLNHNFEIVWQVGAIDIFSNSKVEKDLEIFEDYIVAWDWYGYKHYYNESGEFKTEHYPQYRMSD